MSGTDGAVVAAAAVFKILSVAEKAVERKSQGPMTTTTKDSRRNFDTKKS